MLELMQALIKAIVCVRLQYTLAYFTFKAPMFCPTNIDDAIYIPTCTIQNEPPVVPTNT